MSTHQEANHDQPAVVASTTSSPSDSASGETMAQLQSATDQAGSKSKPRWTARRSWAWAVAGVTGAALAAAGLSVATPIVVQPGTTAGYLYFPKATMAEELLKAEVQKLRAELSKLQDETVKALSDGLVRLRTDTTDLNATDAPTAYGWSLHKHISQLYTSIHNVNSSLSSRVGALEGQTQPAAFDDSSLASRIAALETSTQNLSNQYVKKDSLVVCIQCSTYYGVFQHGKNPEPGYTVGTRDINQSTDRLAKVGQCAKLGSWTQWTGSLPHGWHTSANEDVCRVMIYHE